MAEARPGRGRPSLTRTRRHSGSPGGEERIPGIILDVNRAGKHGPYPSFTCCNVRIDPLPLDRAADRIDAQARQGGPHRVHLCNANNLAIATRDVEYARLLNRGALNLADGSSLVLVVRIFRIARLTQSQRPRGADVLDRTVQVGVPGRIRHYLYGSDAETVGALARTLQERHPGCRIVGAEAPPFRPLTAAEETAAVARMVAARPHIVWVALGAPRQDVFIDAVASRVGTTMVAVGAAFDFLAGTKPEAPRWVQRCGLEWVFRLATEPRRLWRRYLVGNLVFLAGLTRGVKVVGIGEPEPGGTVDRG